MGTTGQQQTLRRLDKPVQRRQTIRLEDYQLLFDKLNPNGSVSLKAIVKKLNDEGVTPVEKVSGNTYKSLGCTDD